MKNIGPELRRVFTGNPGPWGELEFTRISIEPPDEYLDPIAEKDFTRGDWVFKGMTPQQIVGLFQSAQLTMDQFKQLVDERIWNFFDGVTVVHPPTSLILSLSQESRQKIYAVLVRFEENVAQTQPFTFRAELLDERFEKSGLQQPVIDGFRNLLYPQAGVLVFADCSPYLVKLTTRQEKLRFFQVISRRNTYLIKLKISPDTNIEPILSYWDYEQNNRELRALLESLRRVPDGCRIDVSHLLPPFARKRIYSFSRPTSNSSELKHDCHWTAFNFFNEVPDEGFCNPQYTQQTATTKYDPVTTDCCRLGDVVVMFNAAGDTLHSAVYIADDIVFSKNGGSAAQPYIYMRLADMVACYAAASPPENQPQVIVLRRKPAATR